MVLIVTARPPFIPRYCRVGPLSTDVPFMAVSNCLPSLRPHSTTISLPFSSPMMNWSLPVLTMATVLEPLRGGVAPVKCPLSLGRRPRHGHQVEQDGIVLASRRVSGRPATSALARRRSSPLHHVGLETLLGHPGQVCPTSEPQFSLQRWLTRFVPRSKRHSRVGPGHRHNTSYPHVASLLW